jgi:hypothetical protein
MTLGRQLFHWPQKWPHGEPVDQFLKGLGAQEIRSLDASDYEDATDIFDLNDELPEHLRQQFTIVVDGGTLQSVFDFAHGLRNAMALVAPGGTLVVVGPCNNCSGNNFYQYSPDLFFRALAPENGFDVRRLYVEDRRGWYSLADPLAVGKRLAFVTHGPARMYVEARRISSVEPFVSQPQQAHYQLAWSADRNWREHLPPPSGLRRLIPEPVKRLRRTAMVRWDRVRQIYPESVGRIAGSRRLGRRLSPRGSGRTAASGAAPKVEVRTDEGS